MAYPDDLYSITPTVPVRQTGLNTAQQMNLWGQTPQVEAPQMLDSFWGTQGNQGFGMPNYSAISGFGGGSGLQVGGGQGLKFGDYRAPFGSQAGGQGLGFGWNMPSFALGLQGLNSLGSLYMGAKSLGLANKQFESAQKFANINLKNQTQVYNDTLENKLRRIGSFNETPKDQTEAEIARRKLPAYA